MSFDIEAAARNYKLRQEKHRRELEERLLAAQRDAARMIQYIRIHFKPRRIYQWGSLLKPHQFSELSDIDIAVEGIKDVEAWSRMERELLDMTKFSLDLVRWEELWAEHKERILARGRVVYEQPE